MQVRAKLTDESGWQMILTPTETAALLENAGSSISLLVCFEIGAIEFGGGRFVIRVADVLVHRYESGSRTWWTAYCPAGRPHRRSPLAQGFVPERIVAGLQGLEKLS